jgi:hypothetical protein
MNSREENLRGKFKLNPLNLSPLNLPKQSVQAMIADDPHPKSYRVYKPPKQSPTLRDWDTPYPLKKITKKFTKK